MSNTKKKITGKNKISKKLPTEYHFPTHLQTEELKIKEHTEKIYLEIAQILKQYDIKLESLIKLNHFLTQVLEKIKYKNGSIQYLPNLLFAPLQYFGVAGFDLKKLQQSKVVPLKANNYSKASWHRAQMDLQQTMINYQSQKIKQKLIMMCEEYELNQEPSKNNANQNEFQTLLQNKKIDTSQNYLPGEEIINHTYLDIKDGKDNYRVVNIHSSSALEQGFLCEKIQKFIQNFPKKKNQHLIIGGDSNVYYNRGNTPGEKTWCSDGISGINLLMKLLDKIGYITIISKNIIFKTRPHNYFSNGQSSIKFGNEEVETMFIALPKTLYLKEKENETFNYDSNNYFLSLDIKDKLQLLQVSDLNPEKLNAFQGSEHMKNNGAFKLSYEEIFNSKTGGGLISDHVPIYVDIKNTRILFSNNVSLLGKRGIHNSMHLSKVWGNLTIKKTEQTKQKVSQNFRKLEKISDQVVDILIKSHLSLVKELKVHIPDIKKYSGKREKLKYLSLLKLCKF